MNGKYGKNMLIRLDENNGKQYAKIFFKFFNDLYTFLKIQQEYGKFEDNNFITMETFRSLEYIFYVFSCLIKYEYIDNKQTI